MGQLILFPVRRRIPSLDTLEAQVAERERQFALARNARQQADAALIIARYGSVLDVPALEACREVCERAEAVERLAAENLVDARARLEALRQEAG